jgi:hypothetical protein
MEPDVSATLKNRIKDLLLMPKAEIPANILAVLGLRPADFIDPYLRMSAEEVVVLSKPLPQERGEKMITHPCLLDVDVDATTSTWVYQWPRDITPYHATLGEVFGELKNEVLWGNFCKSWANVAVLMDEPIMSLKEKLDAEQAAEAALDAAADEIAMPVVNGEPAASFDDDLDFSTPAMPVNGEPILVLETTAEVDSPITVVHGAGNPAIEAAAQVVLDRPKRNRVLDAMEEELKEPAPEPKRGRGRPAGTTKRAKAMAQELTAEEFVPTEDPSGKKSIPALVRFADQLSQEVGLVDDLTRNIAEAEAFPKDTIRTLKDLLDRLANKAAHLQYKGIRDEDTSGRMDGLIDVTMTNVSSIVTTALRDLELSYDRPDSWDAFGDALKAARDLAGSVESLMTQPCAGPVIREAPETVA